MTKPDLWTPDRGLPDGARAQDWLRRQRQRERDRWRYIRDPRIEEQPGIQCAIALDSADPGATLASGTSFSFNHTCTGSNLILFVNVAAGDVHTDPSSVLYNSVNLTLITSVDSTNAGRISQWYLLGPTTGTHSIQVNFAATHVNPYASGISYTGAKQSGVPDAQTTAAPTGQDHVTMTLTTVADNCWVTCAVASSVSSSGFTYTNLTERLVGEVADSNAVVHPAGSFTGTVTVTGVNQDWSGIMVSFAPFVAGTSPMKRTSPLSGLEGTGSVFRNPLDARGRGEAYARSRSGLYVPERMAA
jgi:hypothetical protein